MGESLLAEVSARFDRAGVMVKTGTLIDASLVEAAVRRPPDGATPKGVESRSAHDPDANWTRQGRSRRPFFGYKVHIGVDEGSGLIRSRTLTPAKVYESEVADALVLGDERAVYAHNAYEKRARRAALKGRGIKDCIQHRWTRSKATAPHWQQVLNKLIRRIRTGVEQTPDRVRGRLFSQIKGRYRLDRMRYRGLAANRLHLDLIAIAHNLYTAART